jgi:hypothetical protein
MADAFLKQYGGSGTGSDDCTAKRNQVLAGVTAVTSDSDDEALTGTMPERGKLSRTLSAGESVTLSEGYYAGGTVSARSLASQTGGATAEDRYVKKGLTYWKDGVLHTGTMETQSAISFSAAARSHDTIRISWKNPAKGPWQGIIVRMSTSGTPGTSGGSEVYRGAGNNPNQASGDNYVDVTGLDPFTTYYFSCINYFAGLDNGTTANVSAKTTHVYLYNHGANPGGLSISDEFTANGISLGADSIVLETKLAFGTVVSGAPIDLAPYSKLIIKFKATDAQYGHRYGFYVSAFLKQNNQITEVAYGSVDWTGSEQTLELEIRTKTSDKLYIQFRAGNASAVGGIQGDIYEIWLE